MRCCLIALGSRGDVAPLLALGRELAGRGHGVRMVVLRDYADLAAQQGLEVVTVEAGQSDALWPEHRLLRWAALAQPGVMYLLMRSRLHAAAPAIADALLAASDDCDVLVAGTASRGAVRLLGGVRDIPVVTLLMAPLLPAATPDAGVLVPPVGGPVLGWAVSTLMWRLTATMGSGPRRAVAERLGTPSTGPVREVVAVATGSTLAAATQPRRDLDVVRTGWLPSGAGDGAAPLDECLDAWLREHPGAVLMGFGSCPSADPARDLALFRAAAREVGRPLIVQTPLLPPGLLDDQLFNAPGADHRWLLPRVAAVVHHGGAGTTTTALACGTPAVVVPHLGDQAWFARRVEALGAGVAAPGRWRLGRRALVRCLRRALEPSTVEQVRRLAPSVVAEGDGARAVADVVEASVA